MRVQVRPGARQATDPCGQLKRGAALAEPASQQVGPPESLSTGMTGAAAGAGAASGQGPLGQNVSSRGRG